jgi:DEAD/DEAH box helicase
LISGKALMHSRTGIRRACVAQRESAGFLYDLYHQRPGTRPARPCLSQAQAIKENRPVLAVGTPGRLAELSREGVLQTHRTPALVLDEVDQLLAPNFREDLSRILEHTGGVAHHRAYR